MGLSFAELEALWIGAGGSPNDAANMAAIAQAESSGNPAAVNYNLQTGDNSHGLWQINVLPGANPQYASWNLADPMTNAKAAVNILQSQGYNAWSTWKNGSAQQYVPQAQAALPDAMSQGQTLIQKAEQWVRDALTDPKTGVGAIVGGATGLNVGPAIKAGLPNPGATVGWWQQHVKEAPFLVVGIGLLLVGLIFVASDHSEEIQTAVATAAK